MSQFAAPITRKWGEQLQPKPRMTILIDVDDPIPRFRRDLGQPIVGRQSTGIIEEHIDSAFGLDHSVDDLQFVGCGFSPKNLTAKESARDRWNFQPLLSPSPMLIQIHNYQNQYSSDNLLPKRINIQQVRPLSQRRQQAGSDNRPLHIPNSTEKAGAADYRGRNRLKLTLHP